MTGDESGAMDEFALIQRILAGDHEAFRDIVMIYEPKLLAYLTALLGNSENARDIAQETFIAAFRALPQWEPPRCPPQAYNATNACTNVLAPWLYRIATNRALNLLKRQPATAQLASEARKDDTWERQGMVAAEPSDEHMLLEDQFAIRELLQKALSQLSEEDAACLILRFVAGERYTEIATRLGMTKEAVRKRVTRGVIALREAYTALDMEVPS